MIKKSKADFYEHDIVILNVDILEDHLAAGSIGTIVHIYSTVSYCEVEFNNLNDNVLVKTLKFDQITKVGDK